MIPRTSLIAVVCTLFMMPVGPIRLCAAPPDAWQPFRARYLEAKRSAAARDDLDLAADILKAADKLDDGDEARMLYERAIELARADTDGYPMAIHAHEALIERCGAPLLSTLVKIVELRETLYRRASYRDRDEAARALVRDELRLARHYLEQDDLEKAGELARSIRTHARRARSEPLEREFDAFRERLDAQKEMLEDEKRLSAACEADPGDARAAERLARFYLFRRQAPAQAKGLFARTGHDDFARLCSLLAKPTDQRELDDRLALGQTAAALAGKRRDDTEKLFLLERALGAFDRYLEQAPADAAGRDEAQQGAERTWAEVKKLRGRDAPEKRYALTFGKEGVVTVPPSDKLIRDSACTVEAWIWLPEKVKNTYGFIACKPLVKDPGRSTLSLSVDGKGRVVASVVFRDRKQGIRTITDGSMKPGAWHHVALAFDSRRLRIFIDGRSAKDTLIENLRLRVEESPLFIGAFVSNVEEINPKDAFQGLIDQVRVSAGVRYRDRFRPDPYLRSDRATTLLLHFDEGRGHITRDTGSLGHHAKVVNARWVRVD